MSIETAIFAVQRGGTQYGVVGSDLNDNLIADDILVLSRGGVTSKFTYTGSVNEIEDTDLFVCTDDDGVTKTVTGAQFKGLFAPASMPWEGHPGGIWHILDISGIMDDFPLDKAYQCYTVDGVDLGSLDNLDVSNPGAEYIVLTGTDCTDLFTSTFMAFKIGPLTDTSRVTILVNTFGNCMFYGYGLENMDVSSVTDMSGTFYSSRYLKDLSEVKNWDTSNVKDMSFMFTGCYLDSAGNYPSDTLALWDVSNVENMESMFRGDRNLPERTPMPFNVESWSPSKCTNMNSIFIARVDMDQDLSGWCVPLMSSPSGPFTLTAMENKTSQHPKWGTCP